VIAIDFIRRTTPPIAVTISVCPSVSSSDYLSKTFIVVKRNRALGFVALADGVVRCKR